MQKKALAEDATWVLLGQVAFVLGGLISNSITLHLVGDAEYGRYVLGMSIGFLITNVFFGGPPDAAKRFYATAQEQGSMRGYWAALLRLTGKRLLMSLPVYALVLALLWIYARDWFPVAIAAFVWSSIWGYNQLYSETFLGAGRRKVFALQQALRSILNIATITPVCLWLGKNGASVLWSVTITFAIILLIQHFIFDRTVVPILSQSTQDAWDGRLEEFAKPYAIWGTAQWAQLASERWSLERTQSLTDVGAFALAVTVGGQAMQVIVNGVVQFLTPHVYRIAGDGTDLVRLRQAQMMVWKLGAVTLGIILVSAAVAALVHRPLFELLYPSMLPGSHLLIWAVLAGGIGQMAILTQLSIFAKGKSQELMLPRIFIGAASVATNYYGALHYGVIGVFVSSMLLSLALNLWILFLAARKKVAVETQ